MAEKRKIRYSLEAEKLVSGRAQTALELSIAAMQDFAATVTLDTSTPRYRGKQLAITVRDYECGLSGNLGNPKQVMCKRCHEVRRWSRAHRLAAAVSAANLPNMNGIRVPFYWVDENVADCRPAPVAEAVQAKPVPAGGFTSLFFTGGAA